MPNVFYLIEEKQVEADQKETILQTSLRASIPHAHACGGTARCSTCRVLITEGLEHCMLRNDKEQRLAERLHFSPEIRPAGQTPAKGGVHPRGPAVAEEDMDGA